MRALACRRIVILSALALALAPEVAFAQTFRFLTETLPRGTTNAAYFVRIVTANADGAVNYSVTDGDLPTGCLLDGVTGVIAGRPTVVETASFTIGATDGAGTIEKDFEIKVDASGGGGNEGVTFTTTSLPDGRVGEAYTSAIEVDNGIGPYIYGASDLPPGVTIDGLTGAITGTPSAAGTFNVLASATDRGENDNKVFVLLPLLVYPAGTSAFEFTTAILDNGEVNVPYLHTITTTGAGGDVDYGASGLPAGLTIDGDTGDISGTPTKAGLFLVGLSATSGGETITTSLPMWITAEGSNFYWDFYGLPLAIVNVPYGRQPPLTAAAVGAVGDVTYAATGLPADVVYGATDGVLSGTPLEVGTYPVTFTATDAGTDPPTVITLDWEFVVLPPNGGDARNVPVNLWVKSQSLKAGTPGKDSWKATYIYNAIRLTGSAFDPAADTFKVTLAGRAIQVDPGQFEVQGNKYSFSSAEEGAPSVKVTIDASKQTIQVSSSKDTLDAVLPGSLRNTLVLGGKSYSLDEYFDEKGKFTVTSGYRKVSFVCEKAKVSVKADGEDTAQLNLLLADPNFSYESGVTEMRVRILTGDTELVDKTFTSLVTGTTSDSKTGGLVYKLKSTKDTETANALSKFSYDSGKGKMTLSLSGLTLGVLPETEAQVSIELTVGARVYYTAVTLFAPKAGSYSAQKP